MFYQITYDHTQYFHPDAVHSVMTNIPGVSEWWHYLPNVYLVMSHTLTEKQIADNIIKLFPSLRFFVAKVDIEATNGMLPKSAWDWINQKSSYQRMIKTFTTPPKGLSPGLDLGSSTGSSLLDDLLGKTKK